MQDPVKYFTPREANQTLPLVKKVVQDILETGHKIRALSAERGAKAQESSEVKSLLDQLETLFDELEALGCSYKDWNFSAGLVDFPAMLDGREVCLCWRSDENELKFYHEIEEGFAGRKPIPYVILSPPAADEESDNN